LAEEVSTGEDAWQKSMTAFDDKPFPPYDQDPPAAPLPQSPLGEADVTPAGDPITYAATTSAYHGSGVGPTDPSMGSKPPLPEDLRISWSWVHFIVFLSFGFISLIVVQAGFAIYYLPHQRLASQSEYEEFILSKPIFAIGSMVLWYGLLFLFLYVTLSVLRGFPFWRTLGWKTLAHLRPGQTRNPWVYFFSGCVLSFLVSIITAKVQAPEHAPIQDLFKYKDTALLFMAMAVLIAPLVEETIFRGYLYPLVAKSFGIVPGIVVTGVLFGLMHGYQLGWTLSLVGVLVLVGVVFTTVRARTGTVFASFLLHLGYNSTIAIVTILGTKGFTQIPTMH
jgi:membrane protease YdiL (CAAX protease family)